MFCSIFFSHSSIPSPSSDSLHCLSALFPLHFFHRSPTVPVARMKSMYMSLVRRGSGSSRKNELMVEATAWRLKFCISAATGSVQEQRYHESKQTRYMSQANKNAHTYKYIATHTSIKCLSDRPLARDSSRLAINSLAVKAWRINTVR